MSLESAVKARLDGYAGLKAHVGTRNFAVTRPGNSDLPATVFEIITEIPVHAMGSDAAFKESRVQVSSFADSFSKVRQVDEQVRAALSRFRGTSGGTVVQDILEETLNDVYHPEVGDGLYQRARDFRVFWEP